jgi:hypothetical protein
MFRFSLFLGGFFVATSVLAGAMAREMLGMDQPPPAKLGEVEPPPAEDRAGIPAAQKPIERMPGLSSSPVIFGMGPNGEFGITSVDRNHPTTKEWIKDGVLSEDQIKKIESGEVIDIDLPH